MKSKSAVGARRTPPAPRKTAKGDTAPDTVFCRKTLETFLYTLALGAGLILLFSLGVYFYPDPNVLIRPLGYTAAALTAFLGGFLSGRLRGGAPIVCGLINGILLTATMLLFSFFLLSASSKHSALTSTLLHTAIPILSVFGALTGVKRKSPATSKRRRTASRR